MFKKGSKVEVLMGKDMPFGGWRVAEVVSGNGHTYGVRYGGSSGMGSGVNVGRVARKDIRPCPPLLDGQDSWNVGDLVEVFDDMSWKMAVILKVLGGNCCLIRLVGSSRQMRLNNASIRVRQLWEGGTWSVLGKGCANYDDMKSNKLSALSCYQKMSSPVTLTDAGTKVESEESCLAAEKNVSFRESCVVSARTLKRGSPFGLFEVETFERKSHKIRVIEKEELLKLLPKIKRSYWDSMAFSWPNEWRQSVSNCSPSCQLLAKRTCQYSTAFSWPKEWRQSVSNCSPFCQMLASC